MYASPFLHMEIARDRQRELIAQAERQLLARQVRDLAKAPRSAAKHPHLRTWRPALRLRRSASA